MTPRLALLLTVPPLLWAGNAVVGRAVAGTIPPLLLNALRWALAAAILLPLGWRVLAGAAERRELIRRWRAFALLGLFGVGCYNAFQYAALKTSTPINVTLIAASTPVFMLALGAALHRIHPTHREIVGALFSIAGVLVVLARGDATQLAQVRFVPGDLLMLAAVVCWAIYTWMLARPPRRLAAGAWPQWTWAQFLLAQTLFGVVWAGAAAGVEAVATHASVRWSASLLAAIAYVAIAPAVIAYRCWGLGVAAAGPAAAAFFANLTPVFAALMSAALLGEPPRAYHAIAFALIVAGIVVSSRRAA